MIPNFSLYLIPRIESLQTYSSMKDLKYLLAYIPAILAAVGLYYQGLWSYAVFIYAFGMIPILDQITPVSTANFSKDEKKERLKVKLFDWLLYLNIPMLYGLLIYFFYQVSMGTLETYELVGIMLGFGTLIASMGINVGHELGHRMTKHERLMSKILLLPALYMHFFIEHNRGHHKNVATPLDPASADKGEVLYAFWFKSLVGGYRNAWKLEAERLSAANLPVMSWANEMIRFQVIQIAYLVAVGFFFGWMVVPLAIMVGLGGALQLETVNYIEHYGLRRKKLESGKYERVLPTHSWNANYELGRIMLYELTRHSDHHYMASKKYQVLDHHDESPELPMGYPASMMMAMVPPLWFNVMDKKLAAYQERVFA